MKKEQKVEIYYDLSIAKQKMNNEIKNGWSIKTCVMGTSTGKYLSNERLLVVYEREKE